MVAYLLLIMVSMAIAAFLIIAILLLLRREEADVFTQVARGNLEQVRSFLEKKPGLLEKRGTDGNTLLHIAAWHGHKELVALLLQKGADIQAKTDQGKTSLSIAEEQDEHEIAELLRSHGAA